MNRIFFSLHLEKKYVVQISELKILALTLCVFSRKETEPLFSTFSLMHSNFRDKNLKYTQRFLNNFSFTKLLDSYCFNLFFDVAMKRRLNACCTFIQFSFFKSHVNYRKIGCRLLLQAIQSINFSFVRFFFNWGCTLPGHIIELIKEINDSSLSTII